MKKKFFMPFFENFYFLPPFQEIDISSETTFEACERQGAGWLFLKFWQRK